MIDTKKMRQEWTDIETKEVACDIAALCDEVDTLRSEQSLVRDIIRKYELDAERADRYEADLKEIGRMIGCDHIDEGLSRCVREVLNRKDGTQ